MRHVCGSAVLAVGTGGICGALLCLQLVQEAYVGLCCACSRYRRHVCGTAVLAVGTGGMRVALLCLQ